MKRLIALILCTVMLLPMLGQAVAAEDVLGTEEAVVSYFQQCKKQKLNEITMTLSPELYETVAADNFAQLSRLQIMGGVVCSLISYREAKQEIILKNVTYDDMIYRECSTESDVLAAFDAMEKAKAEEFYLFCTPEYAETLDKDEILYNAAAKSGFKRISVRTGKKGTLLIKCNERLPGEYAVAEDLTQFDAVLQEFCRKKYSSFTVVFSADLYEKISESREASRLIHGATILESYSYNGSSSYKYLTYTNVEFNQDPKFVCRTEDDIVTAISQMGAAGKTSFSLLFTDELKEAVTGDGFKRLKELEAQAGMSSSSMSYTLDRTKVVYSDAKIVSDAVALDSAQEAMDYVRRQVAAGKQEIHLFCSETLYNYLLADLTRGIVVRRGIQPLYDLAANAGIYRSSISNSSGTHCITIEVEELYPSTRILLNQVDSKTFPLTAKDQTLLKKAVSIVEACKADSETETARNIHDAICEMVTYETLDGFTENDTAYGVLLNGKADCDGYSDAFCLLAGLAGLEARFQHGDCETTGYAGLIGWNATHMWNTVKIDGTWRMVDVTFDDEADGFGTVWFNAGSDLADRMHIWHKELSVELDAATDLTCRLKSEFYVESPEDFSKAAEAAAQGKLPSLKIILMNPENDDNYIAAAREAISTKVTGSFRYSWETKMHMFSASELKY